MELEADRHYRMNTDNWDSFGFGEYHNVFKCQNLLEVVWSFISFHINDKCVMHFHKTPLD